MTDFTLDFAGTVFTKDEVGLLVLLAADLDPEKYGRESVKAVIHKSKALRKERG